MVTGFLFIECDTFANKYRPSAIFIESDSLTKSLKHLLYLQNYIHNLKNVPTLSKIIRQSYNSHDLHERLTSYNMYYNDNILITYQAITCDIHTFPIENSNYYIKLAINTELIYLSIVSPNQSPIPMSDIIMQLMPYNYIHPKYTQYEHINDMSLIDSYIILNPFIKSRKIDHTVHSHIKSLDLHDDIFTEHKDWKWTMLKESYIKFDIEWTIIDVLEHIMEEPLIIIYDKEIRTFIDNVMFSIGNEYVTYSDEFQVIFEEIRKHPLYSS
jgi:hypothetical protein